MADEDQVLVDTEGSVMTVTLNRPEKMNAITYTMIARLLECVEEAKNDDSVRAIVLRGNGRALSAGDDVVSMGEPPYDLPPGEHPVRAMQQRLIRNWYWLRKPTIASIGGRAHGIAEDLCLAADFRIVSDRALLGDMRAGRAVPVASGGTFLLPRMVGLPAATSIMLTGRTFDAQEMNELGLVTKLVEHDDLEKETSEFATQMAAAPTKAIGIMKYELRQNLQSSFQQALDLELDWLDEPVEDREEGAHAFQEKREPSYTGR